MDWLDIFLDDPRVCRIIIQLTLADKPDDLSKFRQEPCDEELYQCLKMALNNTAGCWHWLTDNENIKKTFLLSLAEFGSLNSEEVLMQVVQKAFNRVIFEKDIECCKNGFRECFKRSLLKHLMTDKLKYVVLQKYLEDKRLLKVVQDDVIIPGPYILTPIASSWEPKQKGAEFDKFCQELQDGKKRRVRLTGVDGADATEILNSVYKQICNSCTDGASAQKIVKHPFSHIALVPYTGTLNNSLFNCVEYLWGGESKSACAVYNYVRKLCDNEKYSVLILIDDNRPGKIKKNQFDQDKLAEELRKVPKTATVLISFSDKISDFDEHDVSNLLAEGELKKVNNSVPVTAVTKDNHFKNLLEAFVLLSGIPLDEAKCVEWLHKDAGMSKNDCTLALYDLFEKYKLLMCHEEQHRTGKINYYSMHQMVKDTSIKQIIKVDEIKFGKHTQLVECLKNDISLELKGSTMIKRKPSEIALYMPYASSIARYFSEKPKDKNNIDLAALMVRIGRYYETIALYSKALEWYKRVLANFFESVLGAEHPSTAVIHNRIASVHNSKGEYIEALEEYKKALQIYEKENKADTKQSVELEISIIYNNMAGAYSRQGNYDEAMQCHDKALAIRESVLGGDHLDTATTYSNMADVYSRQGKYAKALTWYNKALKICENVLGAEHPDTVTIYNNIAGVYYRQGNYHDALEQYGKALAIRERTLGVEHPDTVIIYNNIAGIHSRQGNYAKALELYWKVLIIRERMLDENHHFIATTCNNIAYVYSRQGNKENTENYKASEKWYNKALKIRKKALGERHPSTANTYNNIASIHDTWGKYAEALVGYGKALAIRESVLGVEHPDTATTYSNMAGVYYRQGNYAKALELYEKTLVIRERTLGVEHPDTADTYNNIASIHDSQGNYKEALVWYRMALAVRKKLWPNEDHLDFATTYNNMAGIYHRQKAYTDALRWYNKALELRENSLGYWHPATATTYNNIASVHDSQGNYATALVGYETALSIRKKVLGEDHPDTATTYNNIAHVHQKQGDYCKALGYYTDALKILNIQLGPDHPYTIIVQKNYDICNRTMNNVAGG
jgi:tetratricopeptide (TPR) repeat protein